MRRGQSGRRDTADPALPWSPETTASTLGPVHGLVTGFTVILTVATFESALPSVALKVNESDPLKPAPGVYVRFGAVPDNVPCVGPEATEKVNASPSRSDAASGVATAVPWSVDAVPSVATGARFTGGAGFTVIDTVAVFESALPSFALNVNESDPLKPAAGVYVRFGAVPDNVPCVGPDTTE